MFEIEMRDALADMSPSDRLYDVIILGATEVGAMAAISAARNGCRVAMISDSERIGGTTGWAINQPDYLFNKSPGMIQGVTREFFSYIAKHERPEQIYQRHHRIGGQAFPSMYQRAFAALMRGLPIHLIQDRHLLSVQKSGTVITSITIGDVEGKRGLNYSAPIYIDATATGDLVRMALTSKSIGREGNALHGETNAGIQNPTAWPGTAPDPWVIPGDPSSGPLFGISTDPLGTLNAGDGRVMEICYRQLVTSVAADQVPWPEPDMSWYSPARYELLARAFAVNPGYWGDAVNGLGRLIQLYDLGLKPGTTPMGGGTGYHTYADMNSNGPISTGYPDSAECLEYITATPARRAEIAWKAKQWLLGFFYWIANSGDVRIPATIKTALGAYKPSKTELKKYGGISPQIYIREGCRAVGDYVLTQATAIVQNGVPDGIANLVYDFDCKPMRRLIVGGVAVQEGLHNTPATGAQVGAAIPYRVLCPKATECTNLLVPGAPSVSRYVWTALRATPVIMMLGDAAGAAASLVVREGYDVKDVPIDRLQRMLDLKQIWDGIVISSDGYYAAGTRTESGAGAAFASYAVRWGAVGATARSVPANTDRRARYAPNIFRSGWYRVFFSYPPDESIANGGQGRATNLPVTISSNGSTTTLIVNQQYPGGSGGFWDDLGCYYFRFGQPSADYVELNALGTDGIVTDGGMKFMPVNAP